MIIKGGGGGVKMPKIDNLICEQETNIKDILMVLYKFFI